MRVKFQGSFTNGIYFGAKVSNVPLRVNRKLGRMERRQGAVSNQSGLWLLRHVLLMASKCRVIAVTSPFGFSNRINVNGLSTSAAARLVVAAVSLEIANAAVETVLTAVVNSATVAELLLVFPEFLVAFVACIS